MERNEVAFCNDTPARAGELDFEQLEHPIDPPGGQFNRLSARCKRRNRVDGRLTEGGGVPFGRHPDQATAVYLENAHCMTAVCLLGGLLVAAVSARGFGRASSGDTGDLSEAPDITEYPAGKCPRLFHSWVFNDILGGSRVTLYPGEDLADFSKEVVHGF